MAIKTKIQLRRDTLNNWSSANPVLAQGEVALVDKNNSSNFSDPLWVIRIGDGESNFSQLPETAYLLRSELSDVSQGLTDLSNIAGVISGGGLSAAISSVSSAVSSLYLSSSTISSAIDNIYLSSSAISSEVHNKVKIEGQPVEYVNISRVDAETYHGLVNGGTIDQNTVYIVSSDNINAFGERVINVGDAVDLSDAVNLKQLSTVSADIISKSSGDISSVSAAVSSLYLSSSTISSAIDNIYLSSSTISSAVDYLSSQISSIDDDYSVEVSSLGRTGDTYKYAIMQGGESKGQIEVPYDVFVDKGEIQTIGDKKYLLLTLNNEASTVLSIETTDLVDVYTGASTDTISVNVDQYQIEAIVKSDSIDTGHIKDNAITTGKILSASITPDKLDPNGVFVFDCGGAQ